jgi:hypothetical protein
LRPATPTCGPRAGAAARQAESPTSPWAAGRTQTSSPALGWQRARPSDRTVQHLGSTRRVKRVASSSALLSGGTSTAWPSEAQPKLFSSVDEQFDVAVATLHPRGRLAAASQSSPAISTSRSDVRHTDLTPSASACGCRRPASDTTQSCPEHGLHWRRSGRDHSGGRRQPSRGCHAKPPRRSAVKVWCRPLTSAAETFGGSRRNEV